MKSKKVISSLLAVIMLISCFSCLSVVASAFTVLQGNAVYDDENNFLYYEWELSNSGQLTINSFDGYMGTNTWSSNPDKIKSVSITDTAMANGGIIPERAFYGCVNLTTVKVPSAVISIGKYAFNGCTSLLGVSVAGTATGINLPISVQEIGDYCFYGCSALKKATLGASLSIIGKDVFKNCTSLEEVVFQNGITSIGEGMFADCSVLSVIELPDSISAIGAHAFDGCVALTSVNVPDSVVIISDYAFYGCSSIVSASIGRSVKEVGIYVFGACSNLETVTVKTGADCFGDWMFVACPKLSSVNIPDGTTVIGKHTFEGTAISNIVIPNSVTEIQENAFANCAALNSITLGNSLRYIRKQAFYQTGLTSVNIPYSVQTIDDGAFSSCLALTAINVPETNANYRSDDGILYNSSLTVLIICPAGKTGSVKVPDSVKELNENAFMGCANIVDATINSNVEIIPDNAFNGVSADFVINTTCSAYAASYALVHSIKTNITHDGSDEWLETLAPTCTVDGSTMRICSNCKKSPVDPVDTKRVPSLGHSYSNSVTREPSCEVDGVRTYICSRCNDSYTEAIASLGHSYNTGVVTLEPTCTDTGVLTVSCTRCNESYTQIIKKLGHDYDNGEVTLEATCTEPGIMTFSCSRCDETYTKSIKATGHDYDAGVVTLEPTCTEAGITTFTCDNCGDTYTKPIKAIGHKYDTGVVTLEPTCTAEGATTFTCENCGDTYTKPIKAIGHNYSSVITTPATCTVDGVETFTCGNCGDVYTEVIKAAGHTFDDGRVTKIPSCTEQGVETYTCTTCGEHKYLPIPVQHQFYEGWVIGKAATCTEDGIKYHQCAICKLITDETAIPATGHSYTNGICSVCGEWDGKTTLIDQPVLVSAKNTANGVSVKWEAVTGAEKYVIYRKANGKWTKLTTVSALNDTYVDTTATKNGVTYTYTVGALADGSISTYDNTGVKSVFLSVPKLISAKDTVKGVTIKWSKNTAAYGYYVYRKTAKSGWKRIATIASSDLVTYTDKKVSSNGVYYYTVRSFNGASSSSYDASGIKIRFLATPTLSKPQNTKNGISVSWNAVYGAKSYVLYRKAGNGSSWSRLAVVSGKSYVDTTARSGVQYYYTVRAYADGFYGGYNDTGVAYMFLTTPSLLSVKRTSTGVTFKYGKVSAATGYAIYRREPGSSWTKIATVKTNSNVYKDLTAKKGTTYIYTVRALNGSYRSAYNSGITCK